MRKLMLIASATAMAIAMPAMAKPGKGGGHEAKAHAGKSLGRGQVKARGSARTRMDVDDRLDQRTRSQRADRVVDADRDGIPDHRDRRVDRDGDGIDDRSQNRYGAKSCPPGLAKKNNGCLPPGQARKMFAEGQRLPTGYNFYTPYNDIPTSYRTQYGLDPNGRYIYRDGRLYDVDPRTQIVRRIIEGLL
jgi:hypothetical protein